MKRALRRPVAWFALLALVFLQLATAAHACDLVDGRSAPPPLTAEKAGPCDHMAMPESPTRSGVCLEHCKAGAQLVDHHAPVAVADCAAVLSAFWWLPVDTGVETTRHYLVVPRATAPPVFASSGRLRI